ncbi:unnamed protein product [Diamesa serratosioi]
MSEEDRTKLRMNLVAIQKVDPYAKEILDSSSHVAFYKFKSNWEKSDIEGSFFIYSRIAEPYYSIFINNRLNTNSLVEPITKQIELQSQPPFLLYRNDRSKINGFWFYNMEDCDRIHSLVEDLIKNCSLNPEGQQMVIQKNVQNNVQNFVPKGQDVDIFSMLSKAQTEFNTSGNGIPNQQQTTPVKQMNVLAMPDITSQNVVNFFAAATPNSKPSFSSNPNPGMVHQTVTLDEIEKQHRVSASPPNNNLNTTTEPKKMKPQNLNHLLNAAGQNLNNMPIKHQPQPIRLSGNSAGPFVLPHQVLSVEHQQQQQNTIQSSNKSSLITPSMFQTSLNIEEKIMNPQQQIRPEPLTQNQLLQALNYLIENEPDFLTKLHEAYIISFNKQTSH